MQLCYSDFRRFDDKLDAILAGIARLEARDVAELAALHDEISALILASALSQAEKDALAAKIKAALEKSKVTEARVGSVLPQQP
jgi:ribosomal silencing factor RsfS